MEMGEKTPITFADLMRIERLTDPQVSPDGSRVAYVGAVTKLDDNLSRTRIWIHELATAQTWLATPGPGKHSQPAWSPDGQHLAFVSDREEGAQVWLLPMRGGEARRLSNGRGGAAGLCWSPEGQRILFSRTVVIAPADHTGAEDPSLAQIYDLVHPKARARIVDKLFYRHWDAWLDGQCQHLFLLDVDSGDTVDLTPGSRAVPPIALGSARDYDFSPLGDEIAYVMNPDEELARSTNNCLFLQAVAGLTPVGPARNISTSQACDTHPRYSQDGQHLFYLAMAEPGYESDKNRFKVYDRATATTHTWLEDFDRNPDGFAVAAPDRLLFRAQDRGHSSLYQVDLPDGGVHQLTQGLTIGAFACVPGQRQVIAACDRLDAPTDLYLLDVATPFKPDFARGAATPLLATPKGQRLTSSGDALGDHGCDRGEAFWVKGADDTPVHGYLVRPPNFQSRKHYPLILLIHGGPQGAFLDNFHYRWNAQLFASQGAVVAMLNPRGSTGFGRTFKEEISRDWGGRCVDDILLALDQLLERYPFIDPNRIAAAGASFGGYMVNLLAGRAPTRFRALVSHDGIFNLEAMAYTTEELWFDDREHGGLPHEEGAEYQRHSPHRYAMHFQTPMLVIHGEQDFRCPVSEGIALFTALQSRRVPSRFLYFPDEGHWVQQPANAMQWYHEVLGWLTRYLHP